MKKAKVNEDRQTGRQKEGEEGRDRQRGKERERVRDFFFLLIFRMG